MAIWKLISRKAEWGSLGGSYCCQQLEQLFSFMLQRCSAPWELFKRFGKMFLIAVANINTSFCKHSVFAVLAGLAHLDSSTLLKVVHMGCPDRFCQQNGQSHEFSHTFCLFWGTKILQIFYLSSVSNFDPTYLWLYKYWIFFSFTWLLNWETGTKLLLVDQKFVFRQAKMKQFA